MLGINSTGFFLDERTRHVSEQGKNEKMKTQLDGLFKFQELSGGGE